jgi:hypothetical protein
MKIAILLICTGKYISFFEQLYNSFEKYVFQNSEKVYFVFTDSLTYKFRENVVQIFQEKESWPGPTLHRYKYFSRISPILAKYDYIFYSDIDMGAVSNIDESILPYNGLLGVYHPGFYNTSNPRGTPETRKESRVYIAPDTDFRYVCGGSLQGGSSYIYLQAVENMKNVIEDEESRGIIPIFHDESVWNCFVLKNKHLVTFLTPEYCYPESWFSAPNLQGIKPKILALDKNHAEMRG